MTTVVTHLPPFTDTAVILGALARGETVQVDLRMSNVLAEASGAIEKHCERLVEMALFDADEVAMIRLALEEAAANAIIHGNLDIDNSLREEDYLAWIQLLETRANEQPYRDRRVAVTVRISPEQVEYVIADEGKGFDTSLLQAPGQEVAVTTCGGRGMMVMRGAMDVVRHNDRGNCLTLVKRHRKSGEREGGAGPASNGQDRV